jgi:spore germination cell wall hydrolase CwlJ-like protein
MDWPIPADTLPRSAGAADSRDAESAFFVKSSGAAESLGILGCKENGLVPPRPQLRRDTRRIAGFLSSACLGLLLGGSVAHFSSATFGPAGDSRRQADAAAAPVIGLPPPDLLRPLSPEEAAKENAERPFVDRADSPASRFVLKAGAEDRERALTCLTQAVYYEAASEGADGGRAVAQVVLNRMRHPGYPASVCGVVYQGADRTTGCQFTFTCDGSLLRPPVEALWTRSRKIAEEALAGRVFAPVGHATSYHADYVLPYWADALDKSVQIGRHIFYRLPGVFGDGRSFFQRYAGAEPQLPVPHPATELPASSDAAALATALINDGVNGGPAADVEKAAAPASPLVADSAQSALIADAQPPVAPTHRKQTTGECAAASDRKQLSPMGANDMRSGVSAPAC